MARNVINLENVAGYAQYGNDYTNIIEEQRKKKKKQQEKEDSWTDFSAFEDGYQFGDVSKAILGTGVKTAQNFTKGAQSNLEGLLDFGTNVASMGTEALGFNNATKKLRDFAQKDFIAENDLVNKTLINTNPMLALLNQGIGAYDNLKNGYDPGDLLVKNNQIATLFKGQGTLSKGIDKIASNSITGNKLDSLAQTVGQISGQAALGSTGIPWQLTAFANSAGGEMNNAFQNNATAGQAFISGLISGAVEVGTEYIGSGANKLLGMESLGSKGLAKLGSKISNKVVNRLLKIGIDASSEGLEEVLSGLGTAIGQKLTYMNDKELEELYSKDQALDDFIMGALGTVITNVPGQVQSIRRGENALSGLTENEQTVLDKVIEQRTNEAQKDGKELTKKQLNEIEEQAREDLQNGYISADTIEETLGDNYNADKDVMLRESFNERTRRRTNFNTDLNQYKDENQRKIVQKAIDSGILNDSKKTHNFVDLVSKIAADKGMDFDFVNNQKIKDSGFGVEGKTVNGYVNGNTIGLNIESNNALNKTVGHEITHVLEGTELYNSLQDSLKSFIGEREWNNRISELEKTYKNVKGANIENELTSDLVGEYVFNDESFVRSLSTRNPNLFQKIFDEIKYMVKIATAGSKEARDLEKVKRAFEKAYRETSKTQQGTQYSVSEEDLEKYVYPDQVYEAYKNEDKSKITQTIEELEEYKKTLDTETDEGWNENFNTNAKIKALENGYESVYDYYVGEEKKRLRKEIEGEYGRGYRALQEGIQNEKKNNQLQQDIAESTDFKNAQFQVIQNSNPMFDDYHVGIRSPKDIKTFSQAIEDEESFAWGDYTKEDAERDLARDRVTIYSSYPIKQGVFVSTSRIQAEQYAGGEGNQVYSKTVRPEKVAWISGDEGQYASVRNKFTEDIKYSLSVQEANTGTDNQGRELSEQQQEFFKDSKVRDENGQLLEVYHGTPNPGFTVFDTNRSGQNTSSGEYGLYFTDSKQFADDFSYERLETDSMFFDKKGKKGDIYPVYLNAENVLDFANLSEQEINDLYNYASDLGKLDGKEQFVENMKKWQQIGNHQLMKGNLDLKAIADNSNYDGIKAKLNVQGKENEFIVFNSNQIKNVDNTKPTTNQDIRYSLTDNQGRQLTEQQQEYFKDSKVRDEDGRLLELYHGSKARDVNIFEYSPERQSGTDYGEAYYFTSDYNKAKGYQYDANLDERVANHEAEHQRRMDKLREANFSEEARKEFLEWSEQNKIQDILNDEDYIIENVDNISGETKKVYLNLTNPLIVDANGEYYYNVYPSYFEEAREKGNDGIIVKNVIDNPRGEARPIDTYIAFKNNQFKNIDNTNPTSNPDIRYSLSVEEANTTQDNEGRKLNENQLAYFKDSKAVDENGNLVTVYHTMTNAGEQFNEFNPVGTEGYRFGDQVVNYYTNSKDMSGSYADSEYEMADTKRVENINEAKDLISNYNAENETSFEIANNTDGTMSIVDNTYANALSRMRTLWENEFSPEEKARLKEYGEQMEGYIRSGYDNSLYPNFGSLDKVLPDISKKIDNIESNLKSYERDIFSSIRMNPDGEIPSYIQTEPVYVGTYNTENEMLRDVKSALRRANSVRANYQYEGYANLKNPYIVDAENRNWNAVETKENEFTNKIKDLSNESKELLKTLSKDSEKVFRQTEDNYLNLDKAIGDIKRNDTLPKDITGMAYVIQDYYSTLNDFLENQYLSSSSSNMMTMLSSLRNNGLITLDEYADYSYDGTKSNELRNKINDIINKEFEFEGSKYTLKELSNDWHKAMEEYYQKYNHEWDYFYEEADKRIKELNEEDYKILDDLFIEANNGIRKMYLVAKDNFDISKINSIFGDSYTTNDIVKRVIDMNNNGYNYDGVIIKNTRDYGGEYKGKHTANDLYITFNSNQFKAVDNLNPTNDADIRYQLGNNEVAPTSGWNVRSEDVRLQSAFQDTIAPLQEQVQQLQSTLDEVKNNIAPTNENIPAINEQEASQLGSRFNENDIAPIRANLTEQESKRLDFLDNLERENMLNDNLAEERNELMEKEANLPTGEDMTPIESLNDVRDMDEVAKDRSANAYQYEHPEVKPYFQEEARILLAEINEVIPGERFMVEGRDYLHPNEWHGYKRQASEDVANLLDGYTLGTKYTKDQLREGLNAIIEDHGLENKAVSKRLEFMLDDRLRNGYETIEGYQIEPNQDYLNMLKEQSWDKYYDEAPIEEAPNDIRYSAEDELDLAPFEPQERDVMEMVDNEGYRKSTTQNRPPIPYKQKGGLRQTIDAIKSGFINRNVEIDNLSRDSGNRNIKFYGDMMNSAMGEVSYDIGTAQTNNKGETVGKSIKGLFEKAKRQGLGAAFNDFLINYSNIDRYAQNKGSQTPLEVSKRLVRDYAIKYPEFKQWAKDVWIYGKNARQNLVDAGLIDQQLADYLGEIYPHYVPYVSDYENADRYFEGVGELIPKGLKRAKGNAGKLLSVEDALSKYTYAQKMAIRQNELYKEIVHTLGQIPNFGVDERTDYTDMRDSLYTDSRGNYLTAYENGKQITTQVSKDLFKELSRTTENQLKDVEKKLSLITKPLQGVSKLRKSLITTWNPTFPVTNAIKDLQDALFNSKHTKDMAKNYLGAVKELATGKGKEVNQFLALYGSGLTMGEYSSDGLNKLSEKIPLINTIKQINEVVELAPRYAEFKASLQNGESLQEAIYNAREVTTNFNRGGTIAKAMNRNGFTFLNASIQGFDKFIRNFSGQNGAKGIVQAMAKVAALGIAPALFNHLAYDDDEEYEGLKDYIKDNYYLIKTDEGKFIRIPKGRMLSIFGSAARRALDSSRGNEDAFNGYLENAWNQIGINDPGENNVFAPFIQAFGSKNGTAWYGGDIVPSRLQSEKPENQYDEKTDKFSIWLGDKLGVSPKKINYALDQYLGGIGDVLLPMGTEAASSDAESVGEYLTAPWKDKFSADSVEDSKYSSDFYTVKNSIPHGENATDEEQLQYKYMNGISWELTELYKQKREVQSNPDLTKKEKYQQAKEIQREINEKAKQGLEDYKNVEISGDYATINGIKYKKGSDGKWTKQRK